MPKLNRYKLASVLNDCLQLFSSETLPLICDGKVSAAHSGDAADDSVQSRLTSCRKSWTSGFRETCLSADTAPMTGQKGDLLDAYKKVLIAQDKATMAAKLIPPAPAWPPRC